MPQLFEQLIAKLVALIEEFQLYVADIPVLGVISQWPIEQCLAVLGLVFLFIFILVLCIIIGLTVSLPKHLRVNAVKKFYSIDDLDKFKVMKMGKAGSKYYYAEGVNTFRLAMPRWKFADSYGAKEPGKLFNKVIWEESILWLHIRNKVYVLSTKDPWEMVYLVHTLRESGVDILACKQEMDKQEQIESSKPSTDEFIQGMIARMDGKEEDFYALCRRRLEAQGMQVMDAPKNRHGINYFAKSGHTPCLVMCQFVPYKHLNGLEELKEFREAADDLFTTDCIMISTGHITIAAASYANDNHIEVICGDKFVQLMDERVKLDPGKAYLAWELTSHDLNGFLPDDLLKKIFK